MNGQSHELIIITLRLAWRYRSKLENVAGTFSNVLNQQSSARSGR